MAPEKIDTCKDSDPMVKRVEDLLVELVESNVIDIDEFTASIFETITPSPDTISGRYTAVMLALLDRNLGKEEWHKKWVIAVELIAEIEDSPVRERILAIVNR